MFGFCIRDIEGCFVYVQIFYFEALQAQQNTVYSMHETDDFQLNTFT